MVEAISNLENELCKVLAKFVRMHRIKRDIDDIFAEVYKEVYRIYCDFINALNALDLPSDYVVKFSDINEEIIFFVLYDDYEFKFVKKVYDNIAIAFRTLVSILRIKLCYNYREKEIEFAVNKIEKYRQPSQKHFENMLNSLLVVVQLDKYIEKAIEKYEEVRRRWIKMLEELKKIKVIVEVSDNERIKALKEELSSS